MTFRTLPSVRSRGTVLGVIVVLAGGCSGEADIIVDAPASTIAAPRGTPTAAETTSGTPFTDTTPAPGDFETDRSNTLRIAGSGFLLDQAAAYDADSWFLLRGLVRQLVTTVGPGADGRERLVPDLATDTGSANTDYTEWTFTLREGVAFGPGTGADTVEGATGRPITAVDVKYAIERLFLPSVFAAYGFYYESLRGAKGFAECAARERTVAACNGIPGITTSGDRTITFILAEPVPDWPARLALPAAAPVPVDVGTAADAGAVSE